MEAKIASGRGCAFFPPPRHDERDSRAGRGVRLSLAEAQPSSAAGAGPWPLRELLVVSGLHHLTPLPQDIYLLPLHAPSPPPGPNYTSSSFVVVNRSAGLTGLGARYCLSYNHSPPSLTPLRDPGFFLPRETATYDTSRAVLLGWVEEEQLGFFEQVVASVQVPPLRGGGEVNEWLLGCAGKLEMEGILSNPELLVAGILER